VDTGWERAEGPAGGDLAGAGELFGILVGAVNHVLAAASWRHGPSGHCPRGARAVRSQVLGHCEAGCFDDAVEVLEAVLATVWSRFGTIGAVGAEVRPSAVRRYAAGTARSVLGELHRARRGGLGTMQRPERVPAAGWARQALPAAADRELLGHLITWLGADTTAVGDVGWPLHTWAARYGCRPTEMYDWIHRVLDALRASDRERHARYIAGPFAVKPQTPLPFSALERGGDGATATVWSDDWPVPVAGLWPERDLDGRWPELDVDVDGPRRASDAECLDGVARDAPYDPDAGDAALDGIGQLARAVARAFGLRPGPGREVHVPGAAVEVFRGTLTAQFGGTSRTVRDADLTAVLAVAATDLAFVDAAAAAAAAAAVAADGAMDAAHGSGIEDRRGSAEPFTLVHGLTSDRSARSRRQEDRPRAA
jgi:hypothetical protein